MGCPYQSIRDVVESKFIAKIDRANRRDRKSFGRARFVRYSRRPWNNDTEYKSTN